MTNAVEILPALLDRTGKTPHSEVEYTLSVNLLQKSCSCTRTAVVIALQHLDEVGNTPF